MPQELNTALVGSIFSYQIRLLLMINSTYSLIVLTNLKAIFLEFVIVLMIQILKFWIVNILNIHLYVCMYVRITCHKIKAFQASFSAVVVNIFGFCLFIILVLKFHSNFTSLELVFLQLISHHLQDILLKLFFWNKFWCIEIIL